MSRTRRFGLQTRAIASFGLGAALVSATLAITTFEVVRGDLLDQRAHSAQRQTFADARLVQEELGAPTAKVTGVLAALPSSATTHAFILRHGLWFSNAASVSETPIPPALSRAVTSGHVAEQRLVIGGTPTIVVGLPLPNLHAAYFEEHALTDIEATLQLLASVLGVAAVATTVGGALAGWWAAKRLVRPLGAVTRAAQDVSAGSLDRRLPDDPDLQPVVVAFNAMVGNLQARIERDSRFASDVTHELRSPLTTIGASVELLESYRAELPPGGRTAVDALRFEVERFTGMVQDLLDIARMDAGSAELHFTDSPLDELVRTTLASRGSPVPVVPRAEPHELVVRGDRRRLHHVLSNLLDNAERYAGGAVRIVLGRDGPWATICVEDAGPGVAPGERERIFERFYRGGASGRRRAGGGTGLGLALVAEHVRAHGGSVTVDDRPGGGARFTVRLPAAQ